MEDKRQQIIDDIQIRKFCVYGFLKNLTFFKPYLLLYLLTFLDLFHIGFLYAIREIVVYIFEIPSGIFADNYGKKKELCICFIFYIFSFIVFYFSKNFITAAIAMVLFGLGEAFRSGTHKAIILTYLDKNNFKEYKSFVYGRTRSFSLVGTAISSLFSILIILNFTNSGYIFLITVIPYILDFFLILSYPDEFDEKGKYHNDIKDFIKNEIKLIFKNINIRYIILEQAIFQSVFKSIKDMIQPIFSIIIISSSISILSQNPSNSSKVFIGIMYFVFNMASALASRNTYHLRKYLSGKFLMRITFMMLVFIVLSIAVSVKYQLLLVIAVLFLILNVLQDLRKPIYVECLDEEMSKENRATVLSIESQFTAISTAIIAPSFGYVATRFNIFTALVILFCVLFVLSVCFFKRSK